MNQAARDRRSGSKIPLMFLEHFGLRERPFGKSPDPRFLFPAAAHAEALARLEFAAEEREISLLTGEIGCGKTTLIRALVDRVEGKLTPLLIHHPRLTADELILTLLRQLEIQPAGDHPARLDQLQNKVYELHQAGRPLLLIVDEAQLIPKRAVFDELRLLSNFQLDDDNLLAILLVGQPELRLRLQRPALAPLAQRIALRYHVGALSAEETRSLIRHRLETAGGDPGLLGDAAAAAVHRHSGGVPRLINTLCALALLDAFADDSATIELRHVETAAGELAGESQAAGSTLPVVSGADRPARTPLPRRGRSRPRPPAAPFTRKRGRPRNIAG